MQFLETHSLEEPICDICLRKLDETPYRKVILRDEKGEPLILCSHYFFPCWDQDLILNKYPNCEMLHVCFSHTLDELIKKPKIIKNIQMNVDLW